MSLSVAVPIPAKISVFSSVPSKYSNPFVEISSLQVKHIPFLFLCPSAFTISCFTNTALQREQCLPSVKPVFVHVASTASSVTSA